MAVNGTAAVPAKEVAHPRHATRGTALTPVGRNIKTAAAKTKKKTGPASPYPWPTIQDEYVNGIPQDDGTVTYPTHQELTARHGINDKTLISGRASREKWTERRQAAKTAAAMDRRRTRLSQLADISTDIDTKAVDLSRDGLDVIGARMVEIKRTVDIRREFYAVREEILASGGVDTRDEYALPRTPQAIELERLAKAANLWHELGRNALGDDVTRIEISGADGGPVQTAHTHLIQDDTDRLASVLTALERAGVPGFGQTTDAEIVDDVYEVPDVQPNEATLYTPEEIQARRDEFERREIAELNNIRAGGINGQDFEPVTNARFVENPKNRYTAERGYDIQ